VIFSIYIARKGAEAQRFFLLCASAPLRENIIIPEFHSGLFTFNTCGDFFKRRSTNKLKKNFSKKFLNLKKSIYLCSPKK